MEDKTVQQLCFQVHSSVFSELKIWWFNYNLTAILPEDLCLGGNLLKVSGKQVHTVIIFIFTYTVKVILTN